MSLEPPSLPSRISNSSATQASDSNLDYWFNLIDEEGAAAFLDLSVRTMQGYRYRGGGPKFVRVSSRCVKYRRMDCRNWSEARLRTSTSDLGPVVA